MTINEIEQKDLRTVKKIRKIVNQKEKPTTLERVFWKAPMFWLPVLCVVGAVLGLIAFRQSPITALQDAPHQPPTAAMEDASVPDAKKGGGSAVPGMLADAGNDVTAAVMDDPADSPSGAEPIEPETAPILSPAGARVPEAPITAGSTAATDPSVESIPTEKRGAARAFQISHLVTCGGVRDKQYVFAKSTFSLAADSIAMVWMRVLSEAPPHTLTHVYSLNGKHYCDVPLKIPYPHMRTWSKVTLNRDSHIGQWRVDVVAETGEKIDQIDFTVVP